MITGLQEGQELLVGGSNGFQSPSTPANLKLIEGIGLLGTKLGRYSHIVQSGNSCRSMHMCSPSVEVPPRTLGRRVRVWRAEAIWQITVNNN